jgi:glycosyltransferase involved in cell wall biosynthesis
MSIVRIGIIQRILTDYRKPFFEKLADLPEFELSVFTGRPLANEGTRTAKTLTNAKLHFTKNRYLPSPCGYLCWQTGVKQWLCEFNPDVLVTAASPRILSSIIARKWMKARGRPVLGWGLGELPRTGQRWLSAIQKQLAEKFIGTFDAIIAYSSKAARYYANVRNSPNMIFIAHNAIDNSESEKYLQKFMVCNHWLKPWQNSLALHPDLPIILFVGRLIAQKNADLLIEACAPLFPHCQLLIVGDGPAMPDLELQAKPYKKYIRFVGYQTGADLAKCFLAADLFVLPGLGGLAVFQAMSYGKAVIVSFGDGTEEDLLCEGLNGVRFRQNDSEDLRSKIETLLDHPEQLPQMGHESLRIIREKINLDTMVSNFRKALLHTKDFCRDRSNY